MFCILSIFSVLGGALYERRHELELETWVSPERGGGTPRVARALLADFPARFAGDPCVAAAAALARHLGA
jgi:hypothetical protein